ncbi:hypothetical protein L1049_005975 [Liquidambar formosana]|uniref:Nucleotide-diphospho-sugar transferase domain-containing protein n=1 Tax=Liquidambar formosana TaxID=63359 RepID=A0AAP0WQD9_LIQFO
MNPLMPRRVAFHRKRPTATMLLSDAGNFADHDMVSESPALLRRTLLFAVFFVALSLFCFLHYRPADSLRFPQRPSYSSSYFDDPSSVFRYVFPSVTEEFPLDDEEYRLEKVLKDAAMENKTVILTTLNDAWAAPNSVFDLFLESFRIGDRTRRLLNHLVIVALDQKAFKRCLVVHTHCFPLITEGVDFSREAYFMTRDYLKMMWRRIDFLRSVLEMGYSFIFTDADIMWFRDPFPRFYLECRFPNCM